MVDNPNMSLSVFEERQTEAITIFHAQDSLFTVKRQYQNQRRLMMFMFCVSSSIHDNFCYKITAMNRESSEHYKPSAEDEEENYKQELGLKKMLYKYEHQNEQLKAQIKALTERLADILAKKEDQPVQEQKSLDPKDEYRLNLLKQEMKKLYSDIEKVNNEIKTNKQKINEFQEYRCIELENKLKNENKEIQEYKQKMKRYQKLQQMKGFASQTFELKNSSLRITTNEDKLKSIELELEQTRKNIRQLERFRDDHDRFENKRHAYVVNLNQNTRKLSNAGKQTKPQAPPPQQLKNKGIWNMDYSDQNYDKIKSELLELRKEKDRIIESLRNQSIVLKRRLTQLSLEADQLNKSIHLPQIENPKTARHVQKDQKVTFNDKNDVIPGKIPKSKANSPPRLLSVDLGQFERNNDKNFSPIKVRKPL